MDKDTAIHVATATDWDKVSAELSKRSYQAFGDNPFHDRGFKMFMEHVDSMVHQLSSYELAARRSHSHSRRNVDEQLDRINKVITQFDQQLMLVALSSSRKGK